jgi:hypothetical protein
VAATQHQLVVGIVASLASIRHQEVDLVCLGGSFSRF